MLIIASLIAVAVAGPYHRLIAPGPTGPEGIAPIAPGQTGPEGIAPIAPGQTGPEGIEGTGPVAPGPAGPAPIEEFVPIAVGPAIIDDFGPVHPGSVGPAVIDLTPENVITIPGPDGSPLVQIVVNINAPAAEETAPVGVVAPALPGPVNVVDNVVGPDSASLGIPTAPELEVNPAIVMPDLLN